MLIKCPECELQVSDKAVLCPHCGYPMKEKKARRSVTPKRMRLPNGFGQITEIKNKRLSKPFRAMITVGKTDEGRPICKILKPEGYFKTYNEAYNALMEYNKNPYDLNNIYTLEELYNEWSKKYFENITASSTRTIKSAWSYCKSAYEIDVKNIRVGHIKECIDKCDKDSVKSRIKSLFNLLLDYALEYGLVDKNYARDFKVEAGEVKEAHNAFKEAEMTTLWANTSIPFVNVILLQCYTGWRPQELCNIKLEDVDLDNMTMTGGMKTEAGKNRTIPVCGIIQDVLRKIYWLSVKLGSKNLICCNDGSNMSYDMYYKRFKIMMTELGMKHKPHDPRKQFITMCKNANVDEYAIKYLVGHAISDLTEKTYTERSIDWLREEVEKIEG